MIVTMDNLSKPGAPRVLVNLILKLAIARKVIRNFQKFVKSDQEVTETIML